MEWIILLYIYHSITEVVQWMTDDGLRKATYGWIKKILYRKSPLTFFYFPDRINVNKHFRKCKENYILMLQTDFVDETTSTCIFKQQILFKEVGR